jgi:hypothetical protein
LNRPTLLLALLTTTAAAPCTAIHFGPGTSLATIQGTAPANTDGSQAICYTLAVRPGRTVDIALTGPNVGMTVSGVGDMRDHFHFVAAQRPYTLAVGQVELEHNRIMFGHNLRA